MHSTLIHGDLHQGNILGDSEHIIDYDNVQIGNSYHDFFHFAVLSDFDRSDRFKETRGKAIRDIEKRYG